MTPVNKNIILKLHNSSFIKPFLSTFFTLIISISASYAQLDNSFFFDSTASSTGKKSNVYFNLEVNGFLKNTEYYNKIVLGRTLFGYQTLPRFVYYPSENLNIETGAFLWKDFGNSSYSSIEPFFRLKYTKNKMTFIFGNLYGSLSHQLIEPLYEFERFINNRTEQGVQFLFDKKYWKGDIWIDWRKMIYEGSPFQENLLSGISSVLKVNTKPNLKIDFPIQFHVYHSGGQINSAPPNIRKPVPTTVFNFAFGNRTTWFNSPSNWLQAITAENYYVGFLNNSEKLPIELSSGDGWYFNVKLKMKNIGDTYLCYWRGTYFNSVTGGSIFRSESTRLDLPYYVIPYRDLLIMRQITTFNLHEDLKMQLRIEPYIDLSNGHFELAYGFYIRYIPTFLLGNVAKLRPQ